MSAARIVVLDSFAIDQGEPDSTWPELAALGELAVYPQTEATEIVERAGNDTLAVLTNKVSLGAAELSALPALRYVGVTATGTPDCSVISAVTDQSFAIAPSTPSATSVSPVGAPSAMSRSQRRSTSVQSPNSRNT